MGGLVVSGGSTSQACFARVRASGHLWTRHGDLEQAIARYRRGAEAGDIQAMFHLAWVHEQLALQNYRDQALRRIALSLDPKETGDSSQPTAVDLDRRRNAEAAASWYRKSAEAGFSPSMNNLGAMLARGTELPENQAAAFAWYLRAAQAGNPIASLNVTLAYLSGRGVQRNPGEATRWAVWRTKNGLTDDLKDPVLPRTRLFGGAERPTNHDELLREAAASGSAIILTLTSMMPDPSLRTFKDVQDELRNAPREAPATTRSRSPRHPR